MCSLLGSVIRRGEVIEPADLPQSVLTRVVNRYPKAHLHKITTILDSNGLLSGYELDLSVGGKVINVEIVYQRSDAEIRGRVDAITAASEKN